MKLTTTATLTMLAALTLAQGTGDQTKKDIWQPHLHIKDQNITLSPWGSGSIGETNETANEGAFSLRVSTHNYFQGGFIRFATPVDLSSMAADPNSLLAMSIRTAETLVISASEPTAAQGGGAEEGGAGIRRGGAGGRGRPVGGGEGGGQVRGKGAGLGADGGGAPAAAAGSEQTAPTLRMVRVVIATTDGKKSEAYLSLPPLQAKKYWRSIAIPLQAINGFAKTNKIIESIALSGDTTSTYYVGDLRVVNDTTPITAEIRSPRDDLNLALGDTVRFSASGYGGATILRYTWDFDDSDGIQEDSVGAVVEHRFRKPGKFVVTLTVKDVYGLKAPATAKVNVTVNP